MRTKEGLKSKDEVESPDLAVEHELSGEVIEDELIRLRSEEKYVEKIDCGLIRARDSKISSNTIEYSIINLENSECFCGEVTDTLIRSLENSKLHLTSFRDGVMRLRGGHMKVESISDSIVRIQESAEAIIGEIDDAVISIRAGSNVKVGKASNCLFRLEEGAMLNIEENIDSVVGGRGEYTQNKYTEDANSKILSQTADRLAAVRGQIEKL